MVIYNLNAARRRVAARRPALTCRRASTCVDVRRLSVDPGRRGLHEGEIAALPLVIGVDVCRLITTVVHGLHIQ